MTEELLSNTVAAQLLAEVVLNKTPEQWALWLHNNRNSTRKTPYRIPYEKLGGGVFYRREEIAKFAEWEKQRHLGTIKLTGRAAEMMKAFGIGSASGSTTGRKFNLNSINLQTDAATGKTFIQMLTDDPLMVYRLELDEAQAIAKELSEVANAGKRIATRIKGATTDTSVKKTVLIDTPDVLVERRTYTETKD
jgi:hypothetical protein